MATAATLTAPLHVDYSGSANLCTSAGLVWFDESPCSSPKSDHLIIITQNSEGSIGGVLTKPTASSTETVTFKTTTKAPKTATVKTTGPETKTDDTDMVTLTTTETMTIPKESISVSPRALESSSVPKLRTPYTTATVPIYTDYLAETTSTVYDGSDVLFTEHYELLPIKSSQGATSTWTATLPEDLVVTDTYLAGDGSTVTETKILLGFANAGKSMQARRPLFAWAAILFAIAWLVPMASAMHFVSGIPTPASSLPQNTEVPVTTATIPLNTNTLFITGDDTTVLAFELVSGRVYRTSGAYTTATLALYEDNLDVQTRTAADGSPTLTETVAIVLPSDYFGAGISLRPGRSLLALTATLFTVACVIPMA